MAERWSWVPVRVLVLGRPGSGKGTQGARLARLLGVPHISTGDLLRAEIDRDGPVGRQIADHVESGRLVPDRLVGAALAARLSAEDAQRDGFVLDGYPRTIAQAVTLERLLAPARITAAIELLVPEREAEHRLRSRFVCSECGQPALARDPRVGGPVGGSAVCARCGGPLRRRADDDVSVIRERFDEFEESTKPLLEWLDRRRLLVTVDANRPPDVVSENVLAALSPTLSRVGYVPFPSPQLTA